MIENRNVILIMPKYFGYEKYVKQALVKNGNQVHLIFENMDEVSSYYRFVYVYGKNIKDDVMTKFYIRQFNKINGKVDLVIVIRGASLTHRTMKYLQKKFPEAKYFMYQWDSIENTKSVLNVINDFDAISTFDYNDSVRYGWKYRPLFYIAETRKKYVKYDFCFICSLHTQRVKILNQLKVKYGERYSLFLYMNSFFTHYIKQKYLKKSEEFMDLSDRDVKFSALKLEETQKIYSESRIVVDYTRPNQTGFTIRTIESIGHRCKLVTNNKKVLEADFYHPQNVYVYDLDNFNIPKSFIESEYVELAPEIYKEYYIDKWLDDITSE